MGALTEWAGWLSAHRAAVVLAAMAASVVLLVAAVVVRRARRGRPDRWVDGVALVLTLAWSAEGMWEVSTGTMGLGPAFAVPALFVFTSLMVAAMLRAQRHQQIHGHPGKHGRFAWAVAVAEACVVSLSGDSPTEAALRIAVPLLAVAQWWLGMTADGISAELGRTSWRWTPRRLLLAVGAIEPGERDAETVDRDRLVRQMTRVEYRRRHAGKRAAQRYGRRLARLSLKADDDVIAEVRRRVDRATWWQHPVELDAPTQAVAEEAVSALRVGLARARSWVDTRRQARTGHDSAADTAPDTRVDNPVDTRPDTQVDTAPDIEVDTPVDSGQDTAPDSRVDTGSGGKRTPRRPASNAERVARLVKRRPHITQKQAAAELGVSEKTVQRYWPQPINGAPTPELVDAG